jgi:hypothetical protein
MYTNRRRARPRVTDDSVMRDTTMETRPTMRLRWLCDVRRGDGDAVTETRQRRRVIYTSLFFVRARLEWVFLT